MVARYASPHHKTTEQQVMTEELDKELLRIARLDRVAKYAKSIGATDEVAEMFAESQAKNFQWDGVNLTFGGANVVDDEKTKEHFTNGKFARLFTAKADKPAVDPALVESARTNLTAKGVLVRKVGSLAAADALLAVKPDDSTMDDATKENKGKNPWKSGPGFNVTEQGRIFRANPKLAASLAKAAGKTIGARS
jgi:hypothetical protein